MRPGRGQELFQCSGLKTPPGFVISLIFQSTTAIWNHFVLKQTITDRKERITSSCCGQRKTGASEKASVKSVIKCKVQYHVAFRFHLSFLKSFLGQVGTVLPHTNSLLLGLSFESNIHIVHYHLIYITVAP